MYSSFRSFGYYIFQISTTTFIAYLARHILIYHHQFQTLFIVLFKSLFDKTNGSRCSSSHTAATHSITKSNNFSVTLFDMMKKSRKTIFIFAFNRWIFLPQWMPLDCICCSCITNVCIFYGRLLCFRMWVLYFNSDDQCEYCWV
ncbi:uncharacterized protein EV154DRAFT_289725 [Mucor mucedo]|uniref:uncharacterized protein n=1 Tax=Mucor mucedo TaxID=29922 RepID=UPI002220BDBF|nr:uncharacterized protein EV154DRAFT_289725 [Mucor mucedo]KAI7889160.1 hypothetical protein EV154DRAFT_289725 [Mucor mucedo]